MAVIANADLHCVLQQSYRWTGGNLRAMLIKSGYLCLFPIFSSSKKELRTFLFLFYLSSIYSIFFPSPLLRNVYVNLFRFRSNLKRDNIEEIRKRKGCWKEKFGNYLFLNLLWNEGEVERSFSSRFHSSMESCPRVFHEAKLVIGRSRSKPTLVSRGTRDKA